MSQVKAYGLDNEITVKYVSGGAPREMLIRTVPVETRPVAVLEILVNGSPIAIVGDRGVWIMVNND